VVDWSFSFTVDVDRALLYVSLAGPPFGRGFGGDRAGVNLYANSVVALDAAASAVGTFRRCTTMSGTTTCWRRPRCSMSRSAARPSSAAQAGGKSGYLYVLNRVTGEPVFGMEERAVAASDVPGEHLSPTQPIPLKPAPIARRVRAGRPRDAR
jgi:quinoprotein glucose dehydrogenase